MIRILFEAHATSYDNEAALSSGHNDVALSPLGLEQAAGLGKRLASVPVTAVYCSDLQRSYLTGEIAFKERHIPVFRDSRLRECDYGDLTQSPADKVKALRANHVDIPFPHGESYTQTCLRMKSFLDEIAVTYKSADTIVIIGHRATQYGLEHWLKSVPVLEAVTAPWTWQPGWFYDIAPATPVT